MEKGKKDMEAYLTCRKAANYLEGLEDITGYKKKMSLLEKSRPVKDALASGKNLAAREDQLQQQYMEAMVSKDSLWWKNELAKLNTQINNSGSPDEKSMYKRVLNYLGMGAYMYTSNAIVNGTPGQAEQFLNVYELVDPENPDMFFFRASFYARNGNNSSALESLKKAAEHGFSDLEKLKGGDPAFSSLRKMKEYEEIMEQVSQNAEN